jgi:membrane fusion protein, multidrug efflux system
MRPLMALASLLALAGCGKPAGPAASFERPPSPVHAATVKSSSVPLYLDEIGRCVARESVTLKPQVSGQITRVHFVDGIDVKVGDELFTIDPRPFKAQLASANAGLAQAKASLDLAKVEFERAKTLFEKKAIARQELDTTQNAVDVADARARQMEAALDTARLNLDYCSLRSPIEGRTGHRLIDLGNTVTANETALLVIQRLDPIYVDFSVPEGDLAAVRRNMARETLKVEIRIPDEPGDPVVGDLTFVDNAVQEGTGTVMLRATLSNGGHRLWPGRFVKSRLVLQVLKDAVLVPLTAPQMSAKGPFVYVVKPDLTAELRPVTLGQRQGDLVVVEKGLQADERIVTSGHLGVFPGGKVRIETPNGNAAANAEPGR